MLLGKNQCQSGILPTGSKGFVLIKGEQKRQEQRFTSCSCLLLFIADLKEDRSF